MVLCTTPELSNVYTVKCKGEKVTAVRYKVVITRNEVAVIKRAIIKSLL